MVTAALDSTVIDWMHPDRIAAFDPVVQGLVLALCTLILEDATAIGAGLMVASGVLGPWTAVLGTGIGIILGDAGLYAIGVAVRRGLVRWPSIKRRIDAWPQNRARVWFQRSGWSAIALSRMLPGTRVPLYLAAGFSDMGFVRFLVIVTCAVAIWTPMIVFGTAALGTSILESIGASNALGTWTLPLFGLTMYIVLQLVLTIIPRRRALHRSIARLRRFEFWPTWMVYLPLVPWFIVQCLRARGLRHLSCVNPCWPDGGIVGESKAAGLTCFGMESVAPWFVAPARATEVDLDDAVARLAGLGWTEDWTWPVIVKPDVGERGAGVVLAAHESALRTALRDAAVPMLVQRFETGSCELGLFTIRDADGVLRLFSICDKRLPVAVGDGRRSLSSLIASEPRLRMQEPVFREQCAMELERVPARDERVSLGFAGNHSRGCLFLDGERLRTPALEGWIAAIGRDSIGFNYGRLDVRFPDEAHAMSGRGGRILEANGLSSESTNMYDPSWSCWRAWRTMRAHWLEAFRIGLEQREHGVPPATVRGVLSAWRHARQRAG